MCMIVQPTTEVFDFELDNWFSQFWKDTLRFQLDYVVCAALYLAEAALN